MQSMSETDKLINWTSAVLEKGDDSLLYHYTWVRMAWSLFLTTSTVWFSPRHYYPLLDSLICAEYIFSWAMPMEAKHVGPLAEKWLFNTNKQLQTDLTQSERVHYA